MILLDSITRLARAHNTVMPHGGKILSGGVDAKALREAESASSARARSIDGGGSLTIVATALVETGSRMDEVIFEEFKGTGNMELVLDREHRRPPHLSRRSTSTARARARKNSCSTKKELNRIFLLRNFLGDMPEAEAIEFLLKRMARPKNNKEFFQQMARGRVIVATAPRAGMLAIDYGDRRIGLAHQRSDGHDRVAGRPHPAPRGQAAAARRAGAARRGARGARRSSSGCRSTATATRRRAPTEARASRPSSRSARDCRCALVDERYTTAAALRAMREMGGSTRGRKGDVDALAATILLQHALRLAE